MPALPPEVESLVTRQSGLASRRQLLARGMTSGQIDHARNTKRLHTVHHDHGIYTVAPLELLQADVTLMAAVLAFQGRAVPCLQTAALRWGLIDQAPPEIELASRLHLVPPTGVVIRRTLLRPGDVVREGRFRITTVERTLLDVATRFAPSAVDRALAEAEFLYDRRPTDIAAILRRGHPGSAKLRAALERHVPGWGAMRSRLERRFRSLLVEHGVPLPLRNHRVGPWTADCFWPELRVVVELDGGQHERPAQAKVDADRDLWLRQNGYVLRRYTWDQVTRRGGVVIADLLSAFEEGAALVGAPTRTW